MVSKMHPSENNVTSEKLLQTNQFIKIILKLLLFILISIATILIPAKHSGSSSLPQLLTPHPNFNLFC